jgi:hypothetical protein
MQYHIIKSELKWKSREDESLLINKLFYKRNGERKIVSNYKKNFDGLNEHQILKILSKNIYTKHENYLLFYHWYERKYGINIIEDFENSILINPIKENTIVPSVRSRNKRIESEVRDMVIHNLNSSQINGFSVFYEYFYRFLPKIERFSFEEFIGGELLYYLLELFPHTYQVFHDNGKYIRFDNDGFDEEYGDVQIRYNRGLPCFYPRKVGEEYHTFTPFKFLKRSVKELEDVVRESKGIPKIGEGWVSETTLYYELKNHFKDEEVQHHGQPKWLGLQHVDIWFPKYRVGIEYQGKQHDEPIEFFGGEESFIKNQERDRRKKKLFTENNSTLIEVREGYDLKKLISLIMKQINTIPKKR